MLIYHRIDLPVKRRLDLENFSNQLVIEISISNKKVFFVLVYRKYGQNPAEFDDYTLKMDELIKKIDSENSYCTILTGDFNAHHCGWWEGDTDDNFGIQTNQIFCQNGFEQLVKEPTYITGVGSSCIDLVATDQPNFVTECDLHPSLHTNCHHNVNFVKLNVNCPPPPPYMRLLWHYGRANEVAIRRTLSEFDWENNLASRSIDDQVSLFNSVIINTMKNFVPFDDKLIRHKDPPWITKNIKTFYNKYKRKFKKFVRDGRQNDQKAQIDALKQEYTLLVEKSQENYLVSLGNTLANPETGPKKYWTALKKLLKKGKTSIIPPILQNGVFITDTEQKCTVFNDYFQKQCTTVETDSTIPLNMNRTTDATIDKVLFSEGDNLTHIQALDINKAHGYDDISTRMLKICDTSITKPLYIIFKNCITAGYFPKAWKMANLIPIHKKSAKTRQVTIDQFPCSQFVENF